MTQIQQICSCPNCKGVPMFATSETKFCCYCGAEMVIESPPPTCNWCEKIILPYMKICPQCGRSKDDALNTSPLPTCNWCEKIMLPYMRFCPQCGRTRSDALGMSPPPINFLKSIYEKLIKNFRSGYLR